MLNSMCLRHSVPPVQTEYIYMKIVGASGCRPSVSHNNEACYHGDGDFFCVCSQYNACFQNFDESFFHIPKTDALLHKT